MLIHKAGPRLNSKGDLLSRRLHFDTVSSGLGKALCNSIPILSIFALVGISLFMITICGIAFMDSRAYAESYTETSGSSSITLTIGGAGETEQVAAGRGITTYRSHTVRVQADLVNDYALTIAGSTNLAAPSGGSTIAGASNTTGDKMADNTWGYGWGATNTGDSDLTYRALSTTGTDILTVNGANDKPTLTNRAVDFTKKLAFAVKFADNAVPGRYYANVTLSLTATPAILTTYSVAYNANGGTGTSSPASQSAQSYESFHSFTAAAQGTMAKSGYNFLGWAESSSATSASYTAGSSTINLTQANPGKTLYAVWRKVYTYSVTYNCNGGSGCPSNWSANSTNTSYSHTVKSGTPIKSGYNFLGWSTSSTATSASYVAGNTISLTSSSPSRTLYAVWKSSLSWSNITNMQQMTPAICAGASVGATKTLTDTRDSSTYTVRKHSDGNCWMTQNLRIVNKTISSTDSDMTSGSFTIPASSSP